MKFPVKVTYLGSEKTLTAKDQRELDGLLRIGWKLESK